jgi:hypothetical protein
MVLRWWDNLHGKVVIGTLPCTADMEHQVRREMLTGCLAFEEAERLLDLGSATVFSRNDAISALTAICKGCFSSTFLQHWAMWICRRQRVARCSLLYLHAPGRVLVTQGVDDASRTLVEEVSGPVSGPELLRRVKTVAEECGWHIAFDAFASSENAFAPRFFARYAEARAEAEDAFTVTDWAAPSSSLHREVLFACPSPALINRFLAKAHTDGARAIVVVPLSVNVPYWNKFLRASVLRAPCGYVPVRHSQQAARGTDSAGDLAIFQVDFKVKCRACAMTRVSPGADVKHSSVVARRSARQRTRRSARVLTELRSTLRHQNV